MVDHDVDLLIVGGGLIGAMLMLALAPTGLRCLLVDPHGLSDRMDVNFDARSLALSTSSVRILQMLSIWPRLADYVTAIETIHVSEQGHFGSACLHGNANESLGYVVEVRHISRALCELIDHNALLAPATLTAFDAMDHRATVTTPTRDVTVRARFIVAADGADSCMRRFCHVSAHVKAYQHHALVANIGLARHHRHTAYERFTSSGPLALLPLASDRAALVWSLFEHDADRLLQASDCEFLSQLHRAFGYRLGRFIKVGRRVVYPLRQVIMSNVVSGSVVFIGNAAHTLHPVAGQGFNLGLRDVAMLAQCMTQHGLSADMLDEYQRSRRHDQTAIRRFTDGLIGLFTNQRLGVGVARGVGLIALDNSFLLKRILTYYTRGFAGVTPDLVCGIPLHLEQT